MYEAKAKSFKEAVKGLRLSKDKAVKFAREDFSDLKNVTRRLGFAQWLNDGYQAKAYYNAVVKSGLSLNGLATLIIGIEEFEDSTWLNTFKPLGDNIKELEESLKNLRKKLEEWSDSRQQAEPPAVAADGSS